MKVSPAQLLREAAAACLVIGWAVAAHLASSGQGSEILGVALAVLPFVGILAWLAGKFGGRMASLAAVLVALAALAFSWPALYRNVGLLYFLQHAGINLALAAFFGRTLFGPGEALITRIARIAMNGELSPRKIRYTHRVTVAWTAFFVVNASISTGLYLFAPLAVWSVFANLLNAPLVVTMFIAEHLWRLHALPPEERPSIATVVRAWRSHRSHPAA